jgi:hypothetical protein
MSWLCRTARDTRSPSHLLSTQVAAIAKHPPLPQEPTQLPGHAQTKVVVPGKEDASTLPASTLLAKETVGSHGMLAAEAGARRTTNGSAAARPPADEQVPSPKEEGREREEEDSGRDGPLAPSKPPPGGRQAEARWPPGQPDGTTAKARAHGPTPTCGRSTQAHSVDRANT